MSRKRTFKAFRRQKAKRPTARRGIIDRMTSSVPTLTPPLATADPADYLRIIRAIASSTAIETGQAIQDIESRLLARDSRFCELELAALAAAKP